MRLGNARVELYNLDDDLAESNNLIGKHPGIAAELNELLAKHIDNVGKGRRPAAFVKNPKPLLDTAAGVPTLAEYLGMPNLTVREWARPPRARPRPVNKKRK